MLKLIWLLTLTSVVVVGCVTAEPTEDNQVSAQKDMATEAMMKNNLSSDQQTQAMTTTRARSMMTIQYDHEGKLIDVTGSQEIRGINTKGKASGLARATVAEGAYLLLATFENLTQPKGTDFYEGWIVRKNPFDVISTGRLEVIDSKYVNAYASAQNLLDHDFYVLTLEPEDNDPAPTEHIVEGTLIKK